MRQKSKAEAILECYRFAAQARHMAETATNPFERTDFLEVEERWLSLARSPELWQRPAIRAAEGAANSTTQLLRLRPHLLLGFTQEARDFGDQHSMRESIL
jgi:hypothetical protein